MNGAEFLTVAECLLDGETEAEWRSAVSRAYYAVFHQARRILLRCGFQPIRGDQAHAFLWLRLANSGHPDIRQAGLDLQELRGMRNWADYDMDQSMHHHEAAKHVTSAINLVQILQSVDAEPVILSRITEAIKTYERDILHQVTWQP